MSTVFKDILREFNEIIKTRYDSFALSKTFRKVK